MEFLLFGLVLLGVGWFLYKLTGHKHGLLGRWYSESYERGAAQGYAKLAAQGEKPFGKAWSQEFGGSYFLLPSQVEAAGWGVKPDEWRAHTQRGASFLTLGDYSHQDGRGKVETIVPVMTEAGHVLTVAPTRSGKGVGAAVPNLLTYGGAAVVNDIKGELYAITARRREEMGQRVFAFAPFEAESASLNPLDFVEAGQAFEDVRMLAELMIPPSTGDAAFWDNLARNLLGGLILFVLDLEDEKKRNMAEVRHLTTLPRAKFEEVLQLISEGGDKLAARAANNFLGGDEKVRAGVMATLDSHLQIWDSPRLEAVTASSDFSAADLKGGLATVYFILPPEQLSSFAPVVRVMVGMLVASMSKSKGTGALPVLFLLDEFPALGRVSSIEKGIAYLAGYGVRLWFFAQDLRQLAAVYGDEASNSLLSNCAVKQFFGVSDNATAEYVSKYMGDMTAPTISYNESHGGGLLVGGGGNTGTSVAKSGRPLLAPAEVMTMDKSLQLIFAKGLNPIWCKKLNYLELQGAFSDSQTGQPWADKNPFFS